MPAEESVNTKPVKTHAGFGTFKGVFIPSILTILGVIMYLRVGWVLGNAGLAGTLAIVSLSSAITFITGLSIAATATNMKVKGGGAYFMVSRSFGLEAGAAIGIPLYLAQAVGISFYIVGFAESLHTLVPEWPQIYTGLLALFVMALLAVLSADLALKAQFIIFSIILASLVSFFIGKPVTNVPAASVPDTMLNTESFWVVFAVFFPAVTGILSGISMSGDLKDPAKSLPQGTIAAVVLGYIIYMAIPIFFWFNASRDQLIQDQTIMFEIAAFVPLIYAGVWGATLSSALGSLLAGPRTLQALAVDRIVPRFIGKSYGKQNDPRIATIFTFVIAAIGVLFGNLDLIAPILSMFFLTSYGALNLIAGLEGLIGNPSWRPAFRTPWWLSLIGAFGCFGAMMMIDAGSSFIALFAIIAVFLYMRQRSLTTHWSDMRRGLLLYMARSSIYKLEETTTDTRSWRPNLLVLVGSPQSRWYLVEIGDSLTHGKGFLIIASVLSGGELAGKKLRNMERSVREHLVKKKIPALVKVKAAENYTKGAKSLINDYGLGSIEPNTILLGETERPDKYEEFCDLIFTTFRAGKNLLVVRQPSRPPIQMGDLRRQKQIDIWWGRLNNNATLSLTLAYMMQSHPEWMSSELVFKTIATSEEERLGVNESLEQFVNKSRITARVEVVMAAKDRKSFEVIQRSSQGADLVFLGMALPRENQTSADYVQYYKEILHATSGLPMTILTLVGQELSFKDIFTD